MLKKSHQMAGETKGDGDGMWDFKASRSRLVE